jgi:hypothetical protein
MEDLKGTRAYWKFKEEAVDRTVWRTGCGSVVGERSDWMNECKNNFVHSVLDLGQRNKYICNSMKAKFNVGLLHRLAFIDAVNGIAGSSPAEGTDVLLLLMFVMGR